MKNLRFALLGLALLPLSLLSEPIESELAGVRLFMSGAEISRKVDVSLLAGTQELIFTGLPSDIEPSTIQVKSEGNFTIISIGHQLNYLMKPLVTERVQHLTDSLELIADMLNREQSMLKVYEEEAELLKENKEVGGDNATLQVAELRAMADFFRLRLSEIMKLQLDTKKKIGELQKTHERLRNQLGNAQNQRRQVSEIVLTVSSPRVQKGSFSFTYLTRMGGWDALYDIRSENTTGAVDVVLKANVRQNTGEDWSGIPLTLSTANPLSHTIVPELQPWFLRYLEPDLGYHLQGRAPGVMMESSRAKASEMIMDAEEVVEIYSVVQSQTSTTYEFTITAPFRIESGRPSQILEISEQQVDADYTWFAVPRLDNQVYLVAKLADWDKAAILPGEASIFFENTFVGKTWFNPEITVDTLEISMGADGSVTVERNRMTDVEEKKIFSRRVTETIGWEISVRNGKNMAVAIEIRDQIPVSTNADMEITADEIISGRLNEQTGIIIWNMELQPGESKKIPFRYSVKYPADKKIRLE